MPRLVADHVERLRPYEPGKPIEEVERELGIDDCVKMASNENPLGPSPKAVAAIRAALDTVHLYPDGGGYYLKQRLSERSGFPVEQIYLGNGSNECIELIVRTFVRPGMNTVTSEAAFIMFPLGCQAFGVEMRTAPLMSDYRFDLEAMAELVDPQTRIVYIANPNNPTGTYVSAPALDRFIARMDERAEGNRPILLLDEAYLPYVDAPDFPDADALVRRRDRTVVVRTFSKCHGLAGLRLGYGFAPAEMVRFINGVRMPFNVSNLALVAGLAALDDDEHVARAVAMNRVEMPALERELSRRGAEVVPSQTNFLMVGFGCDGRALFEALMAKGVIVRPIGAYGMPDKVRITVGTPDENLRLLRALDEVLPRLRERS